jgi:hypothetical protein
VVTFESHSQVSSLGVHAFCGCSSLASICIPASVEELSSYCFADCESLLTVRFEIGSRLSCVEQSAFSGCASLSAIWIPSSLQCHFGEYGDILRIIDPDG